MGLTATVIMFLLHLIETAIKENLQNHFRCARMIIGVFEVLRRFLRGINDNMSFTVMIFLLKYLLHITSYTVKFLINTQKLFSKYFIKIAGL